MHPLIFTQPTQEDIEDSATLTHVASRNESLVTADVRFNLNIQQLLSSNEHSKTFLVRSSSFSDVTE